MDRKKQIVNNTIIFAIGNFGSKILAYIMVLVYTHYICKSDLGYYDLVLTTVNLLHPILLMAFDEGIYRWLIGNECDKNTVIATCIKATSITTIISIGILFFVNIWFDFRYVWLIALLIALSMMYSMFQNAIRGLTNNKLYAISGILCSILILLLELIGLVVFSMGIDGLLIAQIVAYLLTIVFIYLQEPTLHGYFGTSLNVNLAKDIFKYSFPLVPNQISWWIVNSSDRYIILLFLGTAFNGVYSISNKFPTIITTITSVIYFALQETIIKEYNSADRDEFYSKTFERYYILLFSLICCAIPATNVIIKWFVGIEYISAWRFTGFLYLSTVFSALSSFLGIGYQISRETKRSVVSTVSAAGFNIIINLTLIRFIGLHAASLSTFISYLILFIIRIVHSKKYFSIKVNWFYFCCMTIASSVIMVVSYVGNLLVNIGIVFASSMYLLIMHKEIISTIIKKGQINGIRNYNKKSN